ncbi:MAG TPA: protein kinase [Thermoanaerobaculia bacterium]|jgi:serine/threonine-protein kinase
MTLSAGTRLGPYEILAPLGAGGMGEVYRARDTRLKREVAVKVLPASFSQDPERLRRFEQEARAASALNHPNILTIHDIGTHEGAPYLVSELLEGETLREQLEEGRLPVRKAIAYAVQLARGLAAAHDKGIVHRDLKPENLFVTRDERVKILDFGLAKLTRPEFIRDGSQAPTNVAETEPGTVLGTLFYMSPEQVRGLPADHRSDIFSVGGILYEMLSGRRAFGGETAADTMSAILREEPPEMAATVSGIPSGLERVVRRCLEKSRESRFQSARDLAFALEEGAASAPGLATTARRPVPKVGSRLRVALPVIAIAALFVWFATTGRFRSRIPGGTGKARVASIAVLPLKNLSDDPQQAFFVDGMTEALTSSLAEIRSLKVIARTSAEQYKDSKKPVREIARELGVDSVVEGSIARSGNRIRVAARLIQPESQTQLWAETFDRDFGDVLSLQGEIAAAIARPIQAELTTDERNRLRLARPIDPKAYEAYLLGRFSLDQGTEESLKTALNQFTKALQIQPDYAAAHAALARYYAILPFYSSLSPAEVFPKARAEAEKSLEIDEHLAEAHASLAYVRAYYEWDWQKAEREFRRALDLRPSYADAHFSFSRFLAASGRMDEAVAEIRRSQELDPRDISLKANTALLFYFRGRYDEALEQLFEVRKLDPNLPLVHWGIGLSYEQKGQQEKAIEALQKATSLSKSLNLQSSLGHAYAVFGRRADAQSILNMLRERSKKSYVPSYFSALIYAGLGDRDQAFEWLEKAFQERSTVLAYLRMDPRLAPLRSDPRFAELLRRTGRT